MLIRSFIILGVGFFLLFKGADIFVDGAVGIADRFKIPHIVIALTIVAIGTSIPETAVSLMAASQDNAAICIGNVIGSDIFNALIILGISSVLLPLSVSKRTFRLGIPFMIICAIVLFVMGLDGIITLAEGVVLLVLFVAYICVLIFLSGKNNAVAEQRENMGIGRIVFYLILGLLAVLLGSRITVRSATDIALMLGISERVIGLTVVAFGTSLPELFTSVNAAMKKNADIAVGNIIGSNIYNILFIIGATALLVEIPYDPLFLIDAVVNIFAGLLLIIFTINGRVLYRAGGIVLIMVYAAYSIYLFH